MRFHEYFWKKNYIMSKSTTLSLILGVAVLIAACGTGQSLPKKEVLTATEFSEAIAAANDPFILDVRTPGEFSEGHLEDAVNYDWNGADFEQQVATLDKSKEVYIYCLSGGRSGAAADYMRGEGFTVFEMDGGMMKWRAADLPETNGVEKTSGMSMDDYKHLVTNNDKLVLVDFYAPWCGPCKKMKPYLEEIEKEMADRVKVIRIDVDQHPGLATELRIASIPELKLYKKGEQVWNNIGYIGKEIVVENINAN